MYNSICLQFAKDFCTYTDMGILTYSFLLCTFFFGIKTIGLFKLSISYWVKCGGLNIHIYSYFFIEHNWQFRKISTK